MDELYQKIQDFVSRRVDHPEDREDLVQEIFLKLKKHADQIQHQDRLLPWLYRTASHQVIDYYRSRRPFQALPEILTMEEEETPGAAEEVASWLRFFIGGLKPVDQEIINLVELQGKTQNEAAQLLGLSLVATKSRHQRAKKRLKLALEACCDYFFDNRGKMTGYLKRDNPECCGTQAGRQNY